MQLILDALEVMYLNDWKLRDTLPLPSMRMLSTFRLWGLVM
jgi:hypothetical protein